MNDDLLTLQSGLLGLLLGAPLEPDGGEPPGNAEHALELRPRRRRHRSIPRQTTVLGAAPLDVLVVGVVVRVLGVATTAATPRRLLGDDYVLVRTLHTIRKISSFVRI